MSDRFDVSVVGLYILDILGRPIESIPDGGNVEFIDEIRLTVAGTAGGTPGCKRDCCSREYARQLKPETSDAANGMGCIGTDFNGTHRKGMGRYGTE